MAPHVSGNLVSRKPKGNSAMPIPRLTYETLCALWGETIIRRAFVPAKPGTFW